MLFAFAARPIYFVGQVLYFKLNIDYIIETYCVNKEKPELQCNGKCHLAKQLQVVSNDTPSNDNNRIHVVYESFFPVFFQSYSEHDLEQNFIVSYLENNFYYHNGYSYRLDALLLKPPIV